MDKSLQYEKMLELLLQAELAARNKHWPTCGTAARRAMELAFKFAQEEERNGRTTTI